MEFGPSVLVNAVGFGLIGEWSNRSPATRRSSATYLSAGQAQSRKRSRRCCSSAIPLNSYTTGQLLSVDGGWTAGYGRNF